MVHGSLSRRLLGWQLLIVFALLVSIGIYSVAESNATFRATEGRRMLSAAENLAATDVVRKFIEVRPVRHETLAAAAERARSLSGANSMVIADANGTILTSSDPGRRGLSMPLGESTALGGHAWVGEVTIRGVDTLVAHVPVIGEQARVVGVVAAGRATPNFFQGVLRAPEEPLALLAFATLLGIAGSVLLSRRVKRETLGLEPHEITGLVKHREALLNGVREGVLGLDERNRITLVNDEARTLLSLPHDGIGHDIDTLDLHARARDVLTGRADGMDQIVLSEGHVVVLNRMPIPSVGAVVTMRDRTELVDLQRELEAHRTTTDTLRAQTHEFTNRLHTISGLIELGEYDDLQGYVERVSHTRDQWHVEVSTRIHDPATAALVIAKSSLAAERGVGLRVHENGFVGELDERLSADLVTVLGNLVDNALDALDGAGSEGRDWIEVDIRSGTELTVVVRDSGPGVAPEIVEEVFRHGFTTKAARSNGERGLGLALTQRICHRRGGSVTVHNARGAVFTARLPLALSDDVPAGAGTGVS